MMDINQATQKTTPKLSRILSYAEIVEYLDQKWSVVQDRSLKRFKAIDKILGGLAKNIPAILVAGSNGKSLTALYITKLLKEEGLSVGTLSIPHILTYNECININNESLNNKQFTEVANTVIGLLEQEQIEANTHEILNAIALQSFYESKVNVAVLEVRSLNNQDPTTIYNSKVVAITRITSDTIQHESAAFTNLIQNVADIATKNSYIVSADQSKFNLQQIQLKVTEKGAHWAMPIRKLAVLPYPFEQLHGRCAALAERAAQLYIENFTTKEADENSNSLLIRPKGQRGRPSLEIKRNLELNPRRTIENFWKECTATLPGRFQLLDKEKPSILLDNADSLDALSNTLLGIRLLHYQKPLKGLVIIIGCENGRIHNTELLKQLRYFFKKTSGQVIFCPVKKAKDAIDSDIPWNVETITSDVKNAKVKAQSAKNLADALDLAKKTVDERYGLVVICGSKSIVAEYWHNKGIKKF